MFVPSFVKIHSYKIRKLWEDRFVVVLSIIRLSISEPLHASESPCSVILLSSNLYDD